IGEIMGQAPCNLCWFQRAFMFPLTVMLAVAAFRSDAAVSFYALPVAPIGLLISAFHNLVYFGVIPESIRPCGEGPSCAGNNMMAFDIVPLPVLSLVAFTAIVVLLVVMQRRTAG